jgi:mRNA-degrading endonuclease RelE of RelBE toxin-antitoxin system
LPSPYQIDYDEQADEELQDAYLHAPDKIQFTRTHRSLEDRLEHDPYCGHFIPSRENPGNWYEIADEPFTMRLRYLIEEDSSAVIVTSVTTLDP